MVRGLGPGLPRGAAGGGRRASSPSEQLSLLLSRVIPAPQRAAAGLRVELQRRQPAGARLGDAGASTRSKKRRRAKRTARSSRTLFQKLMRNFTLVAEPQGRRRPEHLPGRLPRPGQHRRVRPQRAAAGRRLDRPGGRHRVDGAVLRRTCCRSPWSWRRENPVYLEHAPASCWRTLPGSPPRPTTSGRTRHRLWDQEDGFFYDVLFFPDGHAGVELHSAWTRRLLSRS